MARASDRRADGFDAGYVRYLRAAEDHHFWFVSRNAIIDALVRQIEAPLAPGYRMLEVGCGTGNTLRVLSAACRRGSLVGLDFQHEGLVFARERVGSRVVQADLRRAPFAPTTRFSLIGLFDVLEHLDDDLDVLSTLRSWLSPDAALLLTVPAAPSLWSQFDEAARHRRRYTADELAGKLAATGFRVEYLSPFMTALYPLMWARRRVARRLRAGHASDAVVADLTIAPVLNSAMTRLLSREVARIRSRQHLPFGTSLIAIARASK